MSVRMRVTRSHTGNRRSHHALKEPRLSKCAECGAQHLRHRMCPECGNYRGRQVVDVAGKKAARMLRREEKLKAVGGVHEHDETNEEVAAEEKPEKKETKKKAAPKKKETKKDDSEKATETKDK